MILVRFLIFFALSLSLIFKINSQKAGTKRAGELWVKTEILSPKPRAVSFSYHRCRFSSPGAFSQYNIQDEFDDGRYYFTLFKRGGIESSTLISSIKLLIESILFNFFSFLFFHSFFTKDIDPCVKASKKLC